MKKENTKNLEIYKKIGILAAPIVLQSMTSSSLGLIDMLMLNRTGAETIAAVGLVNQYMVNIFLILAGIASGCGVFVAQFYGQENTRLIQRTIVVAGVISLAFAVPFTLVSFIFSDKVMALFTKNGTLIEIGGIYLKIVIFSVIGSSIVQIIASTLRSLHMTKMPMIAGVISLLMNTLLNYVLIFGKFGFPELGFKGAAIATLCSRIIELVVLLIVFAKAYSTISSEPLRIKRAYFEPRFLKRFARSTAHMTINDWLYGFAMTVCTRAYAGAGVKALTAIEIANNIQNMTFLFIGGISAAISITIGRQIGRGEVEAVEIDGGKYLRMSFGVGIAAGVLLQLVSPFVKDYFDIGPLAKEYVNHLLIVYSLVMCIRFYNYAALSGVFRGGNDTRWVMLLELSTVWLIAVPMAYIGVYLLHLEIYWVVALVMSEELIKALLVRHRKTSGRWVHLLDLSDN